MAEKKEGTPTGSATIFMDAQELADILHISVHTVYTRLSRNPESLPPRVRLPMDKKVLFHRAAVYEYLKKYIV